MDKQYEVHAAARARSAFGTALLFALVSAFGPVAFAQTTADASRANADSVAPRPSASLTPAARQQGQPAKAPKQLKIGEVNVSGSLRLRAESYGWFETPGFEDEYTFGAAQLRLALGRQFEKWEWLVEGEFPALFKPAGARRRARAARPTWLGRELRRGRRPSGRQRGAQAGIRPRQRGFLATRRAA